MSTVSGPHQPQIEQLRQKRDHLTAERAELADRHQDHVTGANVDINGAEGVEARIKRLDKGIERTQAEIDELIEDERRRIADAVTSGRARVVPGSDPGAGYDTGHGGYVNRIDPWAVTRDRGVKGLSRADARSLAVTAVERCEAMPDSARQYATRAVESETDPEAPLAKYTIQMSDPAYKRAFARWFNDPMSGHYAWSPEEREAWRGAEQLHRAMSIGTGSAGGFLVPYELDAQILISSAGSVDPMREVARVTTTAFNEKRFVTSAGVTASWDAEAAEVSDDSPVLAQPPVFAFKGAAFVPVSLELFEDSDIAQQVGALFTDAKAQLESNAFTVGTGTGQPRGIITALVAAGGATVIATGTNVLAQADLYNNQAALPPRWRPRARWMMNLSILNGYRQLPQATGLNYSIVNDDGPLPKALGWEIRENSAMDGTLTGAAADYLVLSGSFDQYAVIDRVGASVEYVPHLFGAAGRPTGSRGFYMHWRTGGDVLIADAFRLSNFNT